MIAAAIAYLVATVTVPQDTGTLDVPVYRNQAFGVAIPRPFPDWVFSPGGSPQTTTVLFHPRGSSLREQLWGALVLTSFDGPVPLGAVADQRVQTTWQPALGRSFTVLTRDSLVVAGLPALHLVMSGAVARLAVDVEEYFIARGRDLIIVQFRFPRGLPRDSIAGGYQRVFDGLEIRRPESGVAPSPEVAPPAPDAAGADSLANRALAASPWRPRAFEATVRFDPERARADLAVRIEIVNDDTRPRDTVRIAVPWPFTLDAVRSATGQSLGTRPGPTSAVGLPQPVAPQAATALTVSYHLSAAPTAARRADVAGLEVSGERIVCLADWLPRVAAWRDSLGHQIVLPPVRYAIRFEVPEAFSAISAGRLAADFVAAGRRRVTWVADVNAPPVPAFLIGRLRRAALRASPLLTLRVWAPEEASPGSLARADTIADVVRAAWMFYSRAFGRLTMEDVDVALTDTDRPRTTGATIFLGAVASSDSVRVAVARAWWGETVRFAGAGATWLAEALPAWSMLLMRAAQDGDSVRQRLVREAELAARPVAALEAARRAIGDARFRAAVRALFVEHRQAPATAADFLTLLGTDGAAAIGPLVQDR